MQSYKLKPHFTRRSTFMETDDKRIPSALFNAECIAPDLDGFPYPLPSLKSDYICSAVGNNGVEWFAGKSGVTRFDKNAEREEDIIMYFSAERHIPSDNVQRILADGDGLWVLTDNGAAHIEMVKLSAEEKAEKLLDETLNYVTRRGMTCHRQLQKPRDFESRYPYVACDNDGAFSSCHAVGEIFHYAVLKRELGAEHPKTVEARKTATLMSEACLLLMYVHGRDEGFISRSYHLTGEPVPDDGVFYKRQGDTAVCVETTFAKNKGLVGDIAPCSYPIPERLAHLYRDLGFTEDDITYKAETSSDEVTHHYMHMKIAHDILGSDDPELDAIIKDACRRTTKHIIENGFEFCEHTGNPTTWGRWSHRYFNSEIGYVDAPLNAAELLMYLRVAMYITDDGEAEFKETYDRLIDEGYAELVTKHRDRFLQCSAGEHYSADEYLMPGDQMLAASSFWLLLETETDEKLREVYKKGFETWESSLLREHNPGYDFQFMRGCPEKEIDFEKIASWFNRSEDSRLADGVNLRRHDVPIRRRRNTDGMDEVSALLMPDERHITKYDRNPFCCYPESWFEGRNVIEGCYPYTFAYWMGRYYGFIEEDRG